MLILKANTLEEFAKVNQLALDSFKITPNFCDKIY